MHYERPRIERRPIIGLLFPSSTDNCPDGYEYNAFTKTCDLIEG